MGASDGVIEVVQSCETSLLIILLYNSSPTAFFLDIRTLFVFVGTTRWSLVKENFTAFLLVIGGITGRLKRNFSSFSDFYGWTTAEVQVKFKVQLYLYHFLVFCSLVNYLRIRLFSGHHIVNFSVMSNCNNNRFLENIALTSGTDQVEAVKFDPNNWFSAHASADLF